MSEALLNLDPDACVSASNLVRGFGAWQERAMSQPVFVMRRGRPSLVLTSFDLMSRLCVADGADQEVDATRALLFDSMREAVVAIDLHGRIEATNRAARLTFAKSDAAMRDQPLSRVLPEAVAQFLVEHAARARRAGSTEQADIAVVDRQFTVVVAPHPAGALLILDDATRDTHAETLAAAHASLTEAIATAQGAAIVRINLRGYVEPVSSSLAALAGIAEPLLQAVRFVTLLDIASRVTAGAAIEATIRDGRPQCVSARLTRNRGEALPVRIAFAAERSRIAVDAITAFIIVETATDVGAR